MDKKALLLILCFGPSMLAMFAAGLLALNGVYTPAYTLAGFSIVGLIVGCFPAIVGWAIIDG